MSEVFIMRIQPITEPATFRAKRKPKKSDIEALGELGAIFASPGGVILPPNAKPEAIKKFKEIISKKFQDTIKSPFEKFSKK